MSDPEAPETYPSEADVDAVLEEVRGDAREAIKALLHDLGSLAADYEASVSRGYVRGQMGLVELKGRRKTQTTR